MQGSMGREQDDRKGFEQRVPRCKIYCVMNTK